MHLVISHESCISTNWYCIFIFPLHLSHLSFLICHFLHPLHPVANSSFTFLRSVSRSPCLLLLSSLLVNFFIFWHSFFVSYADEIYFTLTVPFVGARTVCTCSNSIVCGACVFLSRLCLAPHIQFWLGLSLNQCFGLIFLVDGIFSANSSLCQKNLSSATED